MTELGPETGPFVGPPTSAQLMALRQLNYIAEVQESAHDTALAPLGNGPKGALSAWRRARKRLFLFVASGLLVFVIGVAVQYTLIHHLGMSHAKSDIIQMVLSVQLSFLLSRYLTWRDRDVRLLPALVRFEVQHAARPALPSRSTPALTTSA